MFENENTVMVLNGADLDENFYELKIHSSSVIFNNHKIDYIKNNIKSTWNDF